jgi:hypothetical protein
VPGTRNWHYLCRRQIGSLLGWTELLSEGHPDGITVELNVFLRTKQWPQILDDDEGGSSAAGGVEIGRQACKAAWANPSAFGRG